MAVAPVSAFAKACKKSAKSGGCTPRPAVQGTRRPELDKIAI
jgi:hypothetical protein